MVAEIDNAKQSNQMWCKYRQIESYMEHICYFFHNQAQYLEQTLYEDMHFAEQT